MKYVNCGKFNVKSQIEGSDFKEFRNILKGDVINCEYFFTFP